MKRRAQKGHITLLSNAALRVVSACNRLQTVAFVMGHTAAVFEGEAVVVIYNDNPVFQLLLLGHPQLCVISDAF